MKDVYGVAVPKKWATGSQYGPLQTDGHNYLCPECGGYGLVGDGEGCSFCKGRGNIALTDSRIVSKTTVIKQVKVNPNI